MRRTGICNTCTCKCSPMNWSRGMACKDYKKDEEKKDEENVHKRR